MTASTVGDLCRRVRVELSAFGRLAAPLLVALDTVAGTAGERAITALADPSLALELARRPWPAGHQPSATVVGQLLDDLRERAGVDVAAASVRTVAEAVAAYHADASRSLATAAGTRASYGTWFKRLVSAHTDDDIAAITAAQLALLIADHSRGARQRSWSQDGRCAEEMAIAAYRHLWAWLVDEGLVVRNIAKSLRKPLRPEPLRRPIRADPSAPTSAHSSASSPT